jgi:hypothetical protein
LGRYSNAAVERSVTDRIASPHEWQKNAVDAFERIGGLFCGQSPGAGKTWVAVQCLSRALRGVYVCPAALRKQTEAALLLYGVAATVVSYNQISNDPELLNRLNPDVLILDEGQKTKRVFSAACARRIARFLATNVLCKVAVLSGSVMHRSVLDYAHMLVWALRQYSPVPRSQAAWQRFALDVERDPKAWLEKLRETPGVFLDEAPSWSGRISLGIRELPLLLPDAYERAETTGVAPDGWTCTEQWASDELQRQLAWGFFMGRDPRPSLTLLDARRTWARCVDNARSYGLADTEKGARSHYPEAYAQWQAAQAAEPEGKAVAEWLADPPIPEAQPGTLIFVHHVALGEKLSALTGWPYHREGTLDANGVKLAAATAPVVLASISACREGVDGAQFTRSHMIWLEPQPDARVFQQGIARLARQGQPADEVTVEIVIAAPIFRRALDSAMKGAHRIAEQTAQRQLLLLGAEKQP